jgi:hypothetical protein
MDRLHPDRSTSILKNEEAPLSSAAVVDAEQKVMTTWAPFSFVHVLNQCTATGYGELFKPTDTAAPPEGTLPNSCLAVRNIFPGRSMIASGKWQNGALLKKILFARTLKALILSAVLHSTI